MEKLKINGGVFPKRKPNLSRWFIKHNVSTDHTSLNEGISRAIESQVISEI